MRTRFSWLLTLLVLTALPNPRALAQRWLSDRARGEGRGIQAGSLELHPGIGAEVGWDSNVFLAEHDPVDRTEQSAILRLSPYFDVATPSESQKLAFRGGVNASLRHYFATNAGTTASVGERLSLKWQPTPVFAWDFLQSLNRTAVPFTDPTGPSNVVGAFDFGRNQIGLGTRLQVSSSSGLLKAGLGYRLDLDIFDASEYDANDTKMHTISADTSWEFLPKTALIWDGKLKLRKFDDPGSPAVGERNDSKETSSRIGINGALTDHIGITLAVGYAAGFFDDNGDYDEVLAQVEARWKLSQNADWVLGYDRSITPSYFGNSATNNRLKTEISALIRGVVLIDAKGEFTFVSFGTDDSQVAAGAAADRTDKLLATTLSGEYRFIDWLAATAEVGYSQNFTNYVYPGIAGALDDPAKWRRIEAWLGVRAFL